MALLSLASKTMNVVSIIVINWNAATFLSSCLEALLTEMGNRDEVLVVDNNSTDESVGLVRSSFPSVKLICNNHNLGYAGGANVGLRAARGHTLMLLNPDVQVQRGWLSRLKDALRDRQIGVVGCKLLYPGGDVIQHAGGIIDWPTALPDHHGYRERDEGQWDERREVDYVTGAALALRQDVLDRVGFFDEDFYPAYFEEVDFCTRVREANYGVLYVPEAVAIHVEHASLDAQSYRYYSLFHRNRLRFVLKHVAPEHFVEMFVAAEREFLAQGLPLNERLGLAGAYLGALLDYPGLYLRRWASSQGSSCPMDVVVTALSTLRMEVWTPRRDRGK